MDQMTANDSHTLIIVRASRVRALTRALLWAAPTALATGVLLGAFRGLLFAPPGLDSRPVTWSRWLVTMPLFIVAIALLIPTLRHLLLAVWIGPLGFRYRANTFEWQLGPFGRKQLDVARLGVFYPYELPEDQLTDAGFEAYLPEEEQHATMLPRITHPAHPGRIDELLLRFGSSDERALVTAFRPIVERIRRDQGRPLDA